MKAPFVNRLIKEKSPYLQQHAHNPIDWYPWGEEAFAEAREKQKPIFLSIGYAACHWCHVMEKESFENASIAQLMNRHFINIKVDREEMPEVDALYMEFAQNMIAGSAGWPLNILLTPELKPFFAATYMPAFTNRGMMGLNELISKIASIWESDQRDKIIEQARELVKIFEESMIVKGSTLPEKHLVQGAVELLFKLADPLYGGMRGAPKFPLAYQYLLLLEFFKSTAEARALFIADRTLESMAKGGIYDHLGGGFSRYSVDEEWRVPHFEKMLYDNALLISAYIDGWLVTKKENFKKIVLATADYILRDMTHSEGGFYSAEDADSEGVEGKFYTWTRDEILSLLGDSEGDLFCRFYSISEDGDLEGRSVLFQNQSEELFAKTFGINEESLHQRLDASRKILWNEREKREHPFKDDKILTGWNGLMIDSLVKAALTLNVPKYLEAAKRSAKFILEHCMQEGRLLRRWRDGQANYPANLEEYAYFTKALITLFEADGEIVFLKWAFYFTELLKNQFKEEKGAFYQTDGTDKNLILRKCSFSDGSEPSGNAVQTENLLRLYQLTGNRDFLDQAEDVLSAARRFLAHYPLGYCYHIRALGRYFDKNAELVVIALNQDEEGKDLLKTALRETYHPNRMVVWKKFDNLELEKLLPHIDDKACIEGKTTLYICREGVCERPSNEIDEMIASLKSTM